MVSAPSTACSPRNRDDNVAPLWAPGSWRQSVGRVAAAILSWVGARRFLVLGNPGQRGLNIGELTGGKSLDPDTGGFGLFLGKFRGYNGMYPHQTSAHFGCEFLLLL